MLDDGSECKKEIHPVVFFPPLPPVPLSGEMDPLKTRQQNQDKLRRKVDPSGMMLCHRQDTAKIYVPQCGSHFLTIALARQTS